MTGHTEDEELVLHSYGEDVGAETRAHVESCPACRARQKVLVDMLSVASDAPVPERDEAYGERVWRQLEPRLNRRPRSVTRLLGTLGVAAAVVIAFLVGRWMPPPQDTVPAASRERVFLAGVEDHLDRSERVLLEVASRDPGKPASLGPERRAAEDLVLSNRLYRQTAVRSGDPTLAQTLGQLERVLIEVENSPDSLSPEEVKDLQKRIDNLLFKVRVIGSRVKHQQSTMRPPATS
jgi:hypothetical protein